MLGFLIACIPAIIIRWVILKKPLSYAVSIFISLGIIVVTVASQMISPRISSAVAIFATSFFILIHKSKKEKSKSTFHEYDHSAVDTICKYCKSDIVVTNIELTYGEFICPNCKKVNYLNNDEITYCQYCDLEVELDPNEKKDKKFICPDCNEENYLGD